jgi:flagellar hook protein FlgE
MSFQTGLSGLNASSRTLDVIGNNIANANTVGMKSSRAEFADLVASSLGAGGNGGGGIGVAVATVSQQFSQGNINITGNNLDVAINGGGFFKVQMPDGTAAYTRDGQFKLDKDGNIITNSGANVMGFPTDIKGTATSIIPQKLVVPTSAPIPASATTAIAAEFNLDARAKVAASTVPPAPITTYGTSMTAFDSQGVEVPVSLYFVKVGPDPSANPPVVADTWNVFDATTVAAGTTALAANAPIASTNAANYALDAKNTALNTANVAVDVANTASNLANVATVGWVNLPTYALNTLPTYPTYTAAGLNPASAMLPPSAALGAAGQLFQMTFDTKGKLIPPATPATLALTSTNPAIGTFNATLDITKATQFGTGFAISNLTQDGYTAGELTGITIDPSGVINTKYSNGQTQAKGQIALADFRNVQGLAPTGGGNWISSYASGAEVLGSAGQGKFGELRSGAVEESNVDLTAELVNMMTAQRAYQANAQTIKTQDQVMTTLVNLR